MISDKQLQANKANAQKSTGPKTEEGKSIVSKNATVHGLRSARLVIDGENPAEFNDFRNDMVLELGPIGAMEVLLVDRIVHAAWRLRRIGVIEVEIYDFIRRPPEDEKGKIAKAKLPEASRHLRQDEKIVTAPQNRFPSFEKAMEAWQKTKDGQLHAQNKWPSEPGYPTWIESFENFKKPQTSQTACGIVSKEISNLTDHAEPERSLDTNDSTDCQLNDQLLPLGRAVAIDINGADLLGRLSRYETTIERSMLKSLRQLRVLQLEIIR